MLYLRTLQRNYVIYGLKSCALAFTFLFATIYTQVLVTGPACKFQHSQALQLYFLSPVSYLKCLRLFNIKKNYFKLTTPKEEKSTRDASSSQGYPPPQLPPPHPYLFIGFSCRSLVPFYFLVGEWQVKVKCSAQEHNTETRPDFVPRPFRPEVQPPAASPTTTHPLQTTLQGFTGYLAQCTDTYS